MKIIVFKYGSCDPRSTFITRHIEYIAGTFDNFMQLYDWNTPMLGHHILWGTGLTSRAMRKFWIKTGHDREELLNRAFARGLRLGKAEVVLAEFGYSGVHILDPCRQVGIPLVVHFHGTDINRTSLVEKYLSGYREMFSYAKGLIAVSGYDKNRLVQLGAQPGKISVIPCGALFPAEYRNGRRSADEYNIISVTRMAEVKAPQLTILAYRKYIELGGKSLLHMVGDGPLLPFCITMTKGLGISDKVVFHGDLPHEKVLQLLESSHMYVQHSIAAEDGDCEGMPVSLMEAAGYSLPIVTTAPGGISEYIEHEKTGFIVEQYDINSMASYMYEIWSQSDVAEKLGQAAYKLAREKFDAKKQAQIAKDVILKVWE